MKFGERVPFLGLLAGDNQVAAQFEILMTSSLSFIGVISRMLRGWIFEPCFPFRQLWHGNAGGCAFSVVAKGNRYTPVWSDKNPINFYRISSIIADLENRKHFVVHYFKRGCVKILVPSGVCCAGPFIIHLDCLVSVPKWRLRFHIDSIVSYVRDDNSAAGKNHRRWPIWCRFQLFRTHWPTCGHAPNFNEDQPSAPWLLSHLFEQFWRLPLTRHCVAGIGLYCLFNCWICLLREWRCCLGCTLR